MKDVEVIGEVRVGSIPHLNVAKKHMLDLLNKPIDGLNIITTQQLRNTELYGWQSPIAKHTDNTGYVFFMPFYMECEDTLKINDAEIELKVGKVICYNDNVPHWTLGNGNVLALFNGPYFAEEITNELKYKVISGFSELINPA